MKYLKLFENVDEYYTSLTTQQGIDFIKERNTDFRDSSISQLEDIFKTNLNPIYEYPKFETPTGDIESYTYIYRYVKENNRLLDLQLNSYTQGVKPINIEIVECEDEWYVVRLHGLGMMKIDSYKCDQMDGLIQCLKDRHVLVK